MKPKIKIYDTQFAHSNGGSFGTGDLNIEPTYFQWYRGNDVVSNIAVFTENSLADVDKSKEQIKILLVLEPPCINPDIYKLLENDIHIRKKFHTVLTHQNNFLNIYTRFTHYFFGGCWINLQDRSVHEKSKNISIIASDKKHTIGHNLRHEIIEQFRKSINGIYGRGYNPVNNKIEALKDYRYSIVVENETSDEWITEKLIDCLITGTIPIYWGTKNISKYFNMDGILQFSTIEDFKNVLLVATETYYNSRIKAVKENFELAKKFTLPEDLIWNNTFKNLM